MKKSNNQCYTLRTPGTNYSTVISHQTAWKSPSPFKPRDTCRKPDSVKVETYNKQMILPICPLD